MKKRFLGLVLMLAMVLAVGGLGAPVRAEVSSTAEFNGQSYTITITRFLCSTRAGTGCGNELSNYELLSYSVRSDNGSKIEIYLNAKGVCATCGEREYNARASATRDSSTATSASSAWAGKEAHVFFTINASPAHVHNWQPNGDGTHSCLSGCGQEDVECEFDIAPTCSTAQQCKVCKGMWNDPTNHEGEEELVDVIPATCHYMGDSGALWCFGCNKIKAYGTATPIDPNNHNGKEEKRNVVPATCKTEGYSGDVYCLGCHNMKRYGASTGFDPKKHEGGTELRNIVTATCKTEGYSGDECCLGCDVEIKPGASTGFDPKKHEGGTELRNAGAPTCAAPGYTGDVCCIGCDAILTPGESIAPTAHQNLTLYLDKPATCTEDGYTGDKWCDDCGMKIYVGQVIPALGHLPGLSALCTVPQVCLTCGVELAPALNHPQTELRGATEPTYTEEGYTGDLWCLLCETLLEKGEVIPKIPVHYYRMTVCSIGPRFRDESTLTRDWTMFTPVDLSADGKQEYDLIAGDKHKVGTVTLTIANGTVTVSCDYLTRHLWADSEFLTFLPSLAETEALNQHPQYAFGEEISIADDLGGDTKVLLCIRNIVYYPMHDEQVLPFEDGAAYQKLVDELKLVMD